MCLCSNRKSKSGEFFNRRICFRAGQATNFSRRHESNPSGGADDIQRGYLVAIVRNKFAEFVKIILRSLVFAKADFVSRQAVFILRVDERSAAKNFGNILSAGKVALRLIKELYLTVSYGYYATERVGAICQLNLATGTAFITSSARGLEKGFLQNTCFLHSAFIIYQHTLFFFGINILRRAANRFGKRITEELIKCL